MGGLTPLECFLAGVAVVSTGLNLLLFLALVSVGKKLRSERGERVSDETTGHDARGAGGLTASSSELRFWEIEKRLSAIEREVRRLTT